MNKTIEYLAGLFDGEGTVTLSRNHKKDQYRHPVISVSSTTYALLMVFKTAFGGQISSHRIAKKHYKPNWIWKVGYDKALRACKKLLPHILEPEKRRRMKLLITKYKTITCRNGKYSKQQKQAKLAFEDSFF